MHTNLMKNIVLSNRNKTGETVRVRILTGPLNGREFQAKKVQENVNGETVNCYHIIDNDSYTYFLEKDIVII